MGVEQTGGSVRFGKDGGKRGSFFSRLRIHRRLRNGVVFQGHPKLRSGGGGTWCCKRCTILEGVGWGGKCKGFELWERRTGKTKKLLYDIESRGNSIAPIDLGSSGKVIQGRKYYDVLQVSLLGRYHEAKRGLKVA